MKKRIVLCSLALIFFISLSQFSLAVDVGFSNFKKVNSYISGKFEDVLPSDWFEKSVAYTYELGLMNGSSETAFSPTGNITLSETIVIAARLHSIYYGEAVTFGKSLPWYQAYIDYAIDNGILKESYDDYTTNATRSQFASILASALPDEAFSAINDIPNIPDVSKNDSYSIAVYKLYNAGILTGSDKYGAFTPNSNIQRNEAATILSRIADTSLRKAFDLNSENKTILSVSQTSLTINQSSSIKVTLKQDNAKVIYTLLSTKKDIVQASWGDFAGNTVPLILKPLKNGTETILITNTYNNESVSIVVNVVGFVDVSEITRQIQELQSAINSQERLKLTYESQLSSYQNRLSSAQSDLAAAQGKQIMVFDGSKFVYTVDSDAVSSAQQQVDYYQREVDYYAEMVDSYNSEINSFKQQIKELQSKLN